MKTLVFEAVAPSHKALAFFYRLLGWDVRYIQMARGMSSQSWVKNITRLEAPSIIHVGSLDQRRHAIAMIETYWEHFKERMPVRALTRLFQDNALEDAFKKQCLYRMVDAWRLRLISQEIPKALPESTTWIIIPSDLKGATDISFLNKIDPSTTQTATLPLAIRIAAQISEILRRVTWCAYASLNAIQFILQSLRPFPNKNTPPMEFATTVQTPYREWSWGVDYLHDGKRIHKENTIYAPLVDLISSEKKRFTDSGFHLAERYTPPTFCEAASILLYTLQIFLYAPLNPDWLLEAYAKALKEYGIWRPWLRHYPISSFITYCDFMPSHISRSILLKQAGVRSIYIVDSINSAVVWDTNQKPADFRHEYWMYLHYDLFLSWCPLYTRYHQTHDQTIGQYLNVGAIWADKISEISDGSQQQLLAPILEKAQGKRIIAAFDSSYHDHGVATYRDGIAFLDSLLSLLEDFPDTFLIFKEKNPRIWLGNFSFNEGELEEMLERFKQLENHPRAHLPGQEINPAYCLAAAEIAISYPFTTTATLALAARKKALYFDPRNSIPGNYYDGKPGMMIHSYPKLKKRIKELLDISDKDFLAWLHEHIIPDLEPYADGNALNRARDAICALK